MTYMHINLSPCDSELEAVSALLEFRSSGHVTWRLPLICVYRPPSSGVGFWDIFTAYIDNVTRSVKHSSLCILGDLNVNCLSDQGPAHFRNMCATHCVHNVVTEPTRFRSDSCLDPICITGDLVAVDVSVMPDPISDHFAVKASLDLECHLDRPGHLRVRTRKKPLSTLDFDDLSDRIGSALTETGRHVTASTGVDELVDKWHGSIGGVLDDLDPYVVKNIKLHKKSPKPWITPELRFLLARRQYLHRRACKKASDPAALEEYRRVRREGTLMNRRLRSQYYQHQFMSVRKQPRGQWQLLNGLLRRHTKDTLGGTDHIGISRTFAQTVSDPIRTHLHCPSGPHRQISMLAISQPTVTDVVKILRNLNAHKAPGADGLPPILFKKCHEVMAGSLCAILRASIEESKFPALFKHASVRALFKGGDRSEPRNYRPVSLLPIASKVLEKHVYNQLSLLLRENPDIIPPQQFAYRRYHSCEEALAVAIDSWMKDLDNGKVVGVVLADVRKAFDSVNHQLLLNELFDCGIGDSALAWFKSYLSDRTQQLIAPEGLPRVPCTQGVPQGSVLGPILFSLYVRGLPSCVNSSTVLQFADDVNMYAAGDSAEEVIGALNGDLAKLSVYLEEKRMTLNPAKTKFLLLHRKTTAVPGSASVVIDGVHVLRAQSARYLGIVIDEHLTFGPQIDGLIGSVNRKLGAYRMSRHLLPFHARRSFYLSVIQSSLEYASSAYVHTLSSYYFDKYVRLFNRCLRIVFGFDNFTSASHILSLYNLSHISVRVNLKLFILVFRSVHSGTCSSLLKEIFHTRSSSAHTTSVTRSQISFSLALPSAHTKAGFSRLGYIGSDRWNMLPSTVRSCTDYRPFVRSCLTFLGAPVRRP